MIKLIDESYFLNISISNIHINYFWWFLKNIDWSKSSKSPELTSNFRSAISFQQMWIIVPIPGIFHSHGPKIELSLL